MLRYCSISRLDAWRISNADSARWRAAAPSCLRRRCREVVCESHRPMRAVICRHENGGIGLVGKYLASSAHVGRDDRHAACSRFQQYSAQRLLSGGVNEQMTLGQQRRHVGAAAQKMHSTGQRFLIGNRPQHASNSRASSLLEVRSPTMSQWTSGNWSAICERAITPRRSLCEGRADQ